LISCGWSLTPCVCSEFDSLRSEFDSVRTLGVSLPACARSLTPCVRLSLTHLSFEYVENYYSICVNHIYLYGRGPLEVRRLIGVDRKNQKSIEDYYGNLVTLHPHKKGSEKDGFVQLKGPKSKCEEVASWLLSTYGQRST